MSFDSHRTQCRSAVSTVFRLSRATDPSPSWPAPFVPTIFDSLILAAPWRLRSRTDPCACDQKFSRSSRSSLSSVYSSATRTECNDHYPVRGKACSIQNAIRASCSIRGATGMLGNACHAELGYSQKVFCNLSFVVLPSSSKGLGGHYDRSGRISCSQCLNMQCGVAVDARRVIAALFICDFVSRCLGFICSVAPTGAVICICMVCGYGMCVGGRSFRRCRIKHRSAQTIAVYVSRNPYPAAQSIVFWRGWGAHAGKAQCRISSGAN